MQSRFAFCVAVALAGLVAEAQAEVWQTIAGDRFEGKLSGVYGPLIVLGEKDGSRQVALEALDDVSLARVADFLQAQAAAPEWSKSSSRISKAIRGRMQVLRDNKLVAFDPGVRREPEIYLAYFGAQWCGPCRRFSPDLVNAYRQLKQLTGDGFELIFVSSDRDYAEQLSYVREVGMPWPVLKFSAVGGAAVVERWKGTGIPNLVALTPDGELIYSSYRNQEYLGPQAVLKAFSGLARAMQAGSDEYKIPRHRLAVLQHLRATAQSDANVRPYVIQLDRGRYRTLEVSQLVATLEVDERGRVAEARFEPAQSVVINEHLTRDAEAWLFLPRIVGGQPQRTTVKLPINW